NLGNDRTVTLMEMIGGLESALGVTATIERHPEQPGDVPQTWASLEKARRMLGYDPRTNYADGVRRFASWIEGVHAASEVSCDLRRVYVALAEGLDTVPVPC